MALRSFRLENQRALRLAAWDIVPPIMVIAGPNGVGKSTLLHALHRRHGAVYDGNTAVIYQPPHRAIRRQQVQLRYLVMGQRRRFQDILAEPQIGGIEGLSIPFPSRSPDNVDEAGSTIKFTLGKIENRRRNLLAAAVDFHREQGQPLDTKDLPDVYAPFNRLITRLLPHLEFRGVDFSDENNIRCIFIRRDTLSSQSIDLDDLSSGEKSIILLFLPLIEDEINKLLESLDPTEEENRSERPDRVFLVDEPEQHLHPDLQTRILGYLRDEVSRASGRLQFILTTHSPTLVDQAFDTELFLLGFPKVPGENQLRRVATNADRLEALKQLTGNAYVVTTGRPPVCVEGTRDESSRMTDIRLLEILHPRASRYVFVPVGGKGNVLRVVTELRQTLAEERFGLEVFGLVDMDRTEITIAGVATWPVSSIENLLLDPDIVAQCFNALTNQRRSADDIDALILDVAREQRDEEVGLRVMAAVKPRTIRIKGATVQEVQESLEEQIAPLRLREEQVREIISKAQQEVDTALADRSYLRVFRGKELLRGLYRKLGLDQFQISYERFTYALAQASAGSPRVNEILEEVFRSLEAAPPAVPPQTS